MASDCTVIDPEVKDESLADRSQAQLGSKAKANNISALPKGGNLDGWFGEPWLKRLNGTHNHTGTEITVFGALSR